MGLEGLRPSPCLAWLAFAASLALAPCWAQAPPLRVSGEQGGHVAPAVPSPEELPPALEPGTESALPATRPFAARVPNLEIIGLPLLPDQVIYPSTCPGRCVWRGPATWMSPSPGHGSLRRRRT